MELNLKPVKGYVVKAVDVRTGKAVRNFRTDLNKAIELHQLYLNSPQFCRVEIYGER